MARNYATETRACPRCGNGFQILRIANRAAFCLECRAVRRRERSQAWKDKNRERERAANRSYQARRRTAPEEQEKDRIYQASVPAETKREIRRRFYWRNAEQMRARRRARRIRSRLAIYQRDGGRCHICGELVPVERFEIDHIHPVSRGGTSDPSNLATSHFQCNRSKAARLLEEVVPLGA